MKNFILVILLMFVSCPCAFSKEKPEGWDSVTRGWSRMPIRVYLDETGEHTEAIQEGFEDWQELSDEKVKFKYVTKAHSGYAEIKVRITEKFSDHTAGLTTAQMNVNKIGKSVVEISTHKANGEPNTEEEMDIIIRHEIGHALGLKHSEDPRSTMYPILLPGQSITNDDLENLWELY